MFGIFSYFCEKRKEKKYLSFINFIFFPFKKNNFFKKSKENVLSK